MLTVTEGDKSPKYKYLTYQNGIPHQKHGWHSGFHIGFLKSPPEKQKNMWWLFFSDSESGFGGTRWDPTSCKWSYNLVITPTMKRPYKFLIGVISPL